ncbi:MAG: acyltransferase [Labilithrix sp.]|nr:acyltransferase [Labilithrix sp.]
MALSNRRKFFALAIFSAMPLLVACPKKDPPPVDAAPPPPPPDEDTGTTVLVPLEEDAGEDVDAGADVKKATGPFVPTNVARLRQCCGQLRIQAKAMGASPEAGMLLGAAAQCDTLAAQAGPSGTAPELGVLKNLLAGRNIPPVCAGF